MRLTFVISALGAGGAERVMATIANYWAEHGWHVTLLTLDDGREPPFYHLHDAIHLRPLAIAGGSPNPLRRVRLSLKRILALRRALAASDPDLVISFIDRINILTLLASRGLRVPVIVSEHIDPAQRPLGRGWKITQKWLYRYGSSVVLLTESALPYFPRRVRQRARVIPNPVVVHRNGRVCENCDELPMARTLLAMGRLDEQKGFDMLLQAFASVALHHPAWSLVIWGDGPQRPFLEARRDALGLRERVSFPGLTKQPFEHMARAHLFVLSSRYEGFPMVLCEAMACGLPVVSFDCPSGPRDIVRDGVDGLLVPPNDVLALAAALDRLMSDENARHRLAQRAPEVLERFGLERVMGMWEETITSLVPALAGSTGGSREARHSHP
jgi:GalNAc-alpha-(1->4)-GalNAc-alpha-(1->3)-diNAcBac-PP-undecaprenol alpha-1,4-N-acetyl-D-galactosaminyltransferase